MSTDRTSLKSAITANNTATIDQFTATIGGLEGQVLDTRSKAAASIYALLTPTQQTKLTSLGGLDVLAGGRAGTVARSPGLRR